MAGFSQTVYGGENMINTCGIITEYCLPAIHERIVELKENLEKNGLWPRDIDIESSDFEIREENLFFISFNQEHESRLRALMKKIYFKKRRIIIISCDEVDYFDFAMEYNICNIINIDDLDETMLLGIVQRFSKGDLGLEPFFEADKIVFDKYYSLSGNLNIRNLIENIFSDFTKKLNGTIKNIFMINCHELVTNALAYGVIGVTAYARDKKAYDFESMIEVPQSKGLQVHLLMDSGRYGISVRDHGGVLTTQRVLERIRRQSVVAGETVPQGIEDLTGRGLTILSHHGLLAFSIKPGVFTEVSLISQLKSSFERKPISILTTEL
jgi:hypothetical protein